MTPPAPMIALLLLLAAVVPPDPRLTPGALCTTDDADFRKVAYAEKIPICRRHVTGGARRTVFKRYRIDPKKAAAFEIDHRYPICLGGSNALENLWPEPKADAAAKDRLEKRLCADLRAGRKTRVEALAELK